MRAACAGSSLIAPRIFCEAALGMGPCSGCSGQVWCRFQLLHSSRVSSWIGTSAYCTAQGKGAASAAVQDQQWCSSSFQCVQIAGRMTGIHECHNTTALMLTQAEEKKRKAELRKASKAAARAAVASVSGAAGSPAAGTPLPLPQGARGTSGGAFASSPPATAAAAGPAPGAGISGEPQHLNTRHVGLSLLPFSSSAEVPCRHPKTWVQVHCCKVHVHHALGDT